MPDTRGDKVSCPGKPEDRKGLPIGMYHCEFCGVMLIAGLPHFNDEDVRFVGVVPYGEQEDAGV